MAAEAAGLDRARQIADEVLLPAALSVDRAERVPTSQLDLLAAEGFYGVAAGGRDTTDDLGALVETFASGCLATTFVWLQHHGAVRAAASSDRPGVRETWLGPLSRGERRSGIALAGLRPGPAPLRVRRTDDGYLLDGTAPWVTGWGLVDTLYLAARDEDDLIHYFLLDAAPARGLTVHTLTLVAVNASRTVDVVFTGHRVPAERLVATEPYAEWARTDAPGSALNGFLALGVANRCLRLLGPGPLDAVLESCRADLVAAEPGDVPAARAAAAELALRAAAALAVSTGSRAVRTDQHAQRLVREATFLLVFGSRSAIRDALLHRLTGYAASC